MISKKKLLGVGISNATTEEILEYILKGLKKQTEKYYVVTPNPEILVHAAKHEDFKNILNNARIACPDGIGVIWAGKVLGKKFKMRTTGVDLLEKLCSSVAKQPITVGFLGGGDNIAERTAECLRRKFLGLKIILTVQGNPDEKTAKLVTQKILNSKKIFSGGADKKNFRNDSKIQSNNIKPRQFSVAVKAGLAGSAAGFPPVSASANLASLRTRSVLAMAFPSASPASTCPQLDILFVAFGFPKQEEWMAKYLGQLPVKVAVGVGGAFDYISGNVSRAPVFVRRFGFEWLYRLIRQPWRLKRQLALIEFAWLVLREKFSS